MGANFYSRGERQMQEKPTTANPSLMPRQDANAHHGKFIGIYAILIILVIGEVRIVHRIDQMRVYVDEQQSQLARNLTGEFNQKVAQQAGLGSRALEAAQNRQSRSLNQVAADGKQTSSLARSNRRELGFLRNREFAAVRDTHQELAGKAAASEVDGLRQDFTSVESGAAAAEQKVAAVSADWENVKGKLTAQAASASEQMAAFLGSGGVQYIPFKLALRKEQTMAGVGLALKKTHRKRSTYDLVVREGNISLEAKNTPAHQAIYFVPPQAPRPYELVVDSVSDRDITGRLGVPNRAAAPAQANPATSSKP